jgi:cysteine desulfurase
VGLGAAAALAADKYLERREAARVVKERFLGELTAVEYRINGDPARVQTHVLNLTFPGVDSEALMLAVRSEVAISNGAACTSASYSPSHVLKAMGLTDECIASAVRVSWGPGVTEIPAEAIVTAVKALRG